MVTTIEPADKEYIQELLQCIPENPNYIYVSVDTNFNYKIKGLAKLIELENKFGSNLPGTLTARIKDPTNEKLLLVYGGLKNICFEEAMWNLKGNSSIKLTNYEIKMEYDEESKPIKDLTEKLREKGERIRVTVDIGIEE